MDLEVIPDSVGHRVGTVSYLENPACQTALWMKTRVPTVHLYNLWGKEPNTNALIFLTARLKCVPENK